jgi:hypothetical protein
MTSAFDTLEYHSTYMGINIYKNISPGFRLKWTNCAFVLLYLDRLPDCQYETNFYTKSDRKNQVCQI